MKLEGLKVDHWSKLICVGFIALSVVAIPLQDKSIFILCLGGFMFGLGEWMNHTKQTKLYAPFELGNNPTHMQAEGIVRKNTAYGVVFCILGASIFGFALYKILLAL
jgi:hypothetical protein